MWQMVFANVSIQGWIIDPRLYPTGHKQGMPLRPIASSIGAVTYQTAKELSKILKPLVGKSPHHVHNNEDLLQHLKGIQLGPDEVIISYDVKALFTSVPIKPALTIIENCWKKTLDSKKEHP